MRWRMNLVGPQALSRCKRSQSRLLFPPRRVSLAALPRSTISLRRTPYFQHLTSVPALGSGLTTGAVICRPPRHRIRDAARARIIFLCLPGVTARCAFTTGLLSVTRASAGSRIPRAVPAELSQNQKSEIKNPKSNIKPPQLLYNELQKSPLFSGLLKCYLRRLRRCCG